MTKLSVETDPSDVRADLDRDACSFLLIDARSQKQYADCHIPGATNMPHRTISAESTAQLARDTLIVVYCCGPACNAAARACAKLSALGFTVKEMIGGLTYWRHEGFDVEGELGTNAPMYA